MHIGYQCYHLIRHVLSGFITNGWKLSRGVDVNKSKSINLEIIMHFHLKWDYSTYWVRTLVWNFILFDLQVCKCNGFCDPWSSNTIVSFL